MLSFRHPHTRRAHKEEPSYLKIICTQVSRAGMIYLNVEDLGWRPYITSWLATKTQVPGIADAVSKLIEKYMEVGVKPDTFQHLLRLSFSLIISSELDSLLLCAHSTFQLFRVCSPAWSTSASTAVTWYLPIAWRACAPSHACLTAWLCQTMVLTLQMGLRPSTCWSRCVCACACMRACVLLLSTLHLTNCPFQVDTLRHRVCFPLTSCCLPSVFNSTKQFASQMWFLFCLIWGIGGTLDEDGRKKFDTYMRDKDSRFPRCVCLLVSVLLFLGCVCCVPDLQKLTYTEHTLTHDHTMRVVWRPCLSTAWTQDTAYTFTHTHTCIHFQSQMQCGDRV